MNFNILHKERVISTNDYLAGMVDDAETIEGTVITAEEQTGGRGYGTNLWEAEKGRNLTFSLLLKPKHIEPAGQFVITQVVSLAIVSVLERHLAQNDIFIKWPNDIYVGNQKIAGILIQHAIKGKSIDHTIAGIGLNVNQQTFLSEAPNPVSMIHFCRNETDKEVLLLELLKEINSFYQRTFSRQQFGHLNKQYLQRLFRMRSWTVYREGDKTFEARITGLGEFGKLRVEERDGSIRTFAFKEIEMII
jgi:BirA family biotin operon repressor/biotin-[acetyl-CoA-carboxylase] ligase